MRILRFKMQGGMNIAVIDGGSIVFYTKNALFHYYVPAADVDSIIEHYLNGDMEYTVGPFTYHHGMVKFSMQGARFEDVVSSTHLESDDEVF